MIGPRRDRDWFDGPEVCVAWAALCLVLAVGCLIAWGCCKWN